MAWPFGSTSRRAGECRVPALRFAVRSEPGCACAPTHGDVARAPGDRGARSRAAKSPESDRSSSKLEQCRVTAVVFLTACLGGANRCGMTDVAGNSEVLHQRQKPPHRTSGFKADDDRSGECGVEVPHGVGLMFQRGFGNFSRVPSSIAMDCWLACKSQPIIRISASFDPSAVRVDTAQSTRAVVRPTSLRHHR